MFALWKDQCACVGGGYLVFLLFAVLLLMFLLCVYFSTQVLLERQQTAISLIPCAMQWRLSQWPFHAHSYKY